MKVRFPGLLICLFIFFSTCKKESTIINDTGTIFNFASVKADSGIDIGDIYQTKNFAAFTDIAYYNGLWYSVFRIGTSHANGENGQIKVLTSADGTVWKVMSNIGVHNIDLRDPKLTVDSAKNNLYLSFFGRNALKHGRVDIQNYITQLDKATNSWTPIRQIQYNHVNGNQFIFWRYTYQKGKMYCIAYRSPVGVDSIKNLCLFISSNDFLSYKSVGGLLNLTGSSSETTLRFAENDSMYLIARTETINSPIGVSLPPYEHVAWINNPLGTILASPDFLFYKNKLLITGRDSQKRSFKFFCYNTTSKKVEKVYTFPSGYETGYGGMSFNPNRPDELWVTYYSTDDNSTSIKLAKINLTQFL
jgi:hypothetical protein